MMQNRDRAEIGEREKDLVESRVISENNEEYSLPATIYKSQLLKALESYLVSKS